MSVSLSQQIEEIERELKLRADVYARQVASGKMRQSVADFHMSRMRAVLRTLELFQEHEVEVRAALEQAIAAKKAKAEGQAA